MKALVHSQGWRLGLLPECWQDVRLCEWLRKEVGTAYWRDELDVTGFRLDPDDGEGVGLLVLPARVSWMSEGARQ